MPMMSKPRQSDDSSRLIAITPPKIQPTINGKPIVHTWGSILAHLTEERILETELDK